MISVLISHPTEGLIIYETGSGKDYPTIWGAPINGEEDSKENLQTLTYTGR